MTEQNKKIQVLSRETDGFTAVINRNPPLRKEDCAVCAPADSKPAHVCLAANCGTLLAPEDFFCEYHFQKLPADLLWAYVKSADGPPRQMLLQQMADTLAREPHADPALLTDLRDFVQGVRNDILDSDPHAERIQAVQQIDALIWRTSKALEANPGRAKLPLSPDQNVPSPNSPSPQRGEGRGEEAP